MPIWQRPELTKAVIAYWQQYITLVVIGSEGRTSANVAQQADYYIEVPNKPLGRKWNLGIQFTASLDYDYLMILGSDDLILPGIFTEYEKIGAEYMGIPDCYFLHPETHEALYWPGYIDTRAGKPIGAFRMFRRALIERLDYTLYEDVANFKLDQSMDKQIPPAYLISGKPHKPIDVKTNLNFNSFDEFREQSEIAEYTELLQSYPTLQEAL